MSRRLAPLALVILAGALALAGDDLPAAVDVCGPRGRDGAHGHPGGSGGGDGGHAGPSSSGHHAGTLDLTIAPTGADGFVVRGTQTPPRAQGKPPGQPTDVAREYSLGDAGTLKLRARGGDGGRGGNGGDGGRGSRGADGSDGSCYSAATSGDRGGPGGDGGSATSGSDGGDAGNITVTLSGRDTHLLLLLEPDVEPGRGGAAGHNGRGGSGGPGGDGGRGHSAHDKCPGSSSGSTGSTGRSGSSGSAHVSAGKDGARGLWTIRVDGTAYFDRYRLALTGFSLESDNADGVFEPGELMHVRKIAMRNDGDVPTPPPALHETRIYLPLTRNLIAPTAPLQLPLSLAKGRDTVLPEEFRFRIPDVDVKTTVVVNERYRDEGLCDPRARLADAHRDHPEFPNAQTFPIGFPIGVRPLRIASAVAAGESYRFFLEIENLAKQPFGAEVEDQELRRAIRLVLRYVGDTLGPESIDFRVENERPFDFAQGEFVWDLAQAPAGAVTRLEVVLGIKPDAPLYAGAHLDLDLAFGKLESEPRDMRIVERRSLPLRVAARWRSPEVPSLVLVTNVGVERDAVAAWKSLAASLGLGLAIWDVSYYGFLPLGQRSADRSDALLLEAAKDQVVVVLNNAFSSPVHDAEGRRQMARAWDLLVPGQVVRAVTQGVGVLTVGGNITRKRLSGPSNGNVANPSLADLLVPGAPERTQEHADPDAMIAWLEQHSPASDDWEVLHRVTADGGWLWGDPEASDLEEIAEDLSAALQARWPDRRYMVSIHYAPTMEDGVFWNTHHYGALEVRRTEDGTRAGLNAVEVADPAMQGKEYVSEPSLLEALLRSFRFERKVELLAGYLDGDLPIAQPGGPTAEVFGAALASAILLDLRAELRLWTRDRWSGLAMSGTYRKLLVHHAALAGIELKAPVDPSSPRAACALEIAAGIEALGPTRWGVSDVVVPFGARRYYVAAATSGTSKGDGLVDDFRRAVFGQASTAGVKARAAKPPRTLTMRCGLGALEDQLVLDGRATKLQRAHEAARAERESTFLSSLDQLNAETFMPEGLDAEGR